MDGWIDRWSLYTLPFPSFHSCHPGERQTAAAAAQCTGHCLALHRRRRLRPRPIGNGGISPGFSMLKWGVIWVGKTIIKHPHMGMIYTRLYHLWFNSCLQYGTLVRPMPYLLAWLPHLHMVINGQIRKHGVAVNLPDNYNLFWVYSVCTFDSPKRETRANGTWGMLFLGLAAIQKNMKVTPLVPCNHAYIPYQLELPLS